MVYSTVPASIGLATTTDRLQETAGRIIDRVPRDLGCTHWSAYGLARTATAAWLRVIGLSNRRVAHRAACERRLILPGPIRISPTLSYGAYIPLP
jgi:hypothetical protein